MEQVYNPFSLKGKTILVTGASSGIGRGIAMVCSKMGASVIITGRNGKRLNETLLQIDGNQKLQILCDLTDQNQIEELVTSVPKLDGVVHCAGVGQRILAKQLDPSDVTRVMKINFDAPVILQTSLLKNKKINKGSSIVFIASIASYSPSIGNSIYSASKGALVSYVNCLSLELAPRNIRVNCISPAMVWTELITADGIDQEQLKEDEAKYPLKRYGQPEDIAYLSVYLLSDAASWMTGSNIKINGGGILNNL